MTAAILNLKNNPSLVIPAQAGIQASGVTLRKQGSRHDA
jgi:hypothetical protein